MNNTLKIKFLSGPQQGTKYSLKPPMVCTIGRSDDCTIVIKDDGKVSWQHCQIEVADSILIKDLDSSNGILINGKKIAPKVSHPLVDEDEVMIGDSIIKIEIIKTQDVPDAFSVDTNIEHEKLPVNKTEEVEQMTFEKNEKSVPFDAPHNAQDVEDNMQNSLPPKTENKILDDQPNKETDQRQTVNKEIVVNKPNTEIDKDRLASKIENLAFGKKPKKKIKQNRVLPKTENKILDDQPNKETDQTPAVNKEIVVNKPNTEIDKDRLASKIEALAFGKKPKKKINQNKPGKEKISIIEKSKNLWKKVNIIEKSKNLWKKINIIGNLKNFWKEISTIANQTSSLVPLEETQHDNEKIENDQNYDKEKMLHIIVGTYKPVHLNQLFIKEEFNLTDFILNVIFWLTEKVHSGTCLFIRYVKAFLQYFFSKVSWSMRFAFMLTLLGTLAIAIGEFGADKYISMSGFDVKQVKLLQSTGILSSFNLFSTLSIYVGCLMLVSMLILLLKNRISLLFLKISAAAFGVITLWTLLFLVRIPSLMLEMDKAGKLFDKYYRNQLWITWVWLWVIMALLAFVFLTIVTLCKVKQYYCGTKEKQSNLIGDKIVEDLNNSKDSRFRSSTYWAGFLHIFILFLPFLMIRGCMKDYEIPKGDGAPQKVVIKKIEKPKKKKEFIFNMNSAISFYVPELDDEMMKELDKETEDQYKASNLVGKPSKKGGKPGWPNGMEDARIRFIRLKYAGGDWDQNMGKGADYNFLLKFRELTNFKIADNTEAIEIADLRRFRNNKAPPFVYITGQGNINLSQKEIQTLRWYLTEQGGMLFADNGGGNFNNSIRSVILRVFPEREFVDIANDDIIYQAPYYFPDGAPRLFHHSGDRALGINYNGRWAVFYHQGDINDAWQTGGSGSSEAVISQAYKMGVNVVNYAFTTYMGLHYSEE